MSSKPRSLGIALATAALLAVALFALATAPRPAGDWARSIEQQLRCPVCQSVSIAESPSSTAAAMRRDVRQQLAAGRSESQIIGYFRARYGPWVVLDPPVQGDTLLVWLLPLAGAGVGVAIVLGRTRRGRLRSAELSPAQRDRVARAVERTRSAMAEKDDPQ